MNSDHTKQCKHIDEHIDARIEKLTSNLQDFITQRMSGYDSNLLKAIQDLERKVDDHHDEMKPWLEAKVGLNLLGRWFITIPIIVATLLGIKTLLGWFGFHK